jgi:fructokinase
MSDNLSKQLAIGLGEILWDLLPTGKQLGGAPANFAYHAKALGSRAGVVSAVGDDPLGQEILTRLRDLDLDTAAVAVDHDHPTGTVSVHLDPAGIPSYIIHPEVAWDFIPATDAVDALARSASATCFGSLAQRNDVSRQTIHSFLDSTPKASLRIFDINVRQTYYTPGIVTASLDLANVLKINDQELPMIAELLDLPVEEGDTISTLLEQFNLRLIALTRGPRGSSLYTPEESSHHDGFPVEIVDTVGAGDAFTAALATGLLKREPLHRINEFANRLASYVCSQPGATPAVPSDLLQWEEPQ